MPNRNINALALVLSAVVLAGCQGDDSAGQAAQPEDPFEDPWINAIDTGEPTPVVASAEPAQENAPDSAPTLDPSAEPGPEKPAKADAPTPANPAPEASAQAGSKATPEPTADAPAQPSPEPTAEALPAEPAPAVEPPPAPAAEPAPAPEPKTPPPITIADFDGNFRYTGGQRQRDDLAAAIDKTVDALSVAIRGIARKRLSKVNPVEGKVDITVSGDKVTTTFASGFTATGVVGGPSAKTKALDGSGLDVRFRFKGNKLVQQMKGKGGARTIVYVLSADRKKLTVHQKITSPRLPVPLSYQLSYSRK